MKKIILIVMIAIVGVQCGQEEQGETSAQEKQSESTKEVDNGEPWAEDQLLDPAILAATLEDEEKDNPYVFSLFYGGIEHSETFGPVRDKENLAKLRERLEDIPRDAEVVVYCGCCPFKDCPNVRPGFALLNEMGFSNHKLLNLSENLKVDWIEKGYPTQEEDEI